MMNIKRNKVAGLIKLGESQGLIYRASACLQQMVVPKNNISFEILEKHINYLSGRKADNFNVCFYIESQKTQYSISWEYIKKEEG